MAESLSQNLVHINEILSNNCRCYHYVIEKYPSIRPIIEQVRKILDQQDSGRQKKDNRLLN